MEHPCFADRSLVKSSVDSPVIIASGDHHLSAISGHYRRGPQRGTDWASGAWGPSLSVGGYWGLGAIPQCRRVLGARGPSLIVGGHRGLGSLGTIPQCRRVSGAWGPSMSEQTGHRGLGDRLSVSEGIGGLGTIPQCRNRGGLGGSGTVSVLGVHGPSLGV